MITKPLTTLALCACFATSAAAEEVQDSACYRDYAPELVSYLQGANDYTIYQGNHQGRWADADGLIFSIGGHSYRQNRFWIDGIRIDNRFTPGSTLYTALYANHAMEVRTDDASLSFGSKAADDYVRVTGNVGGAGGINPTTVGIVHLFHGTGSEDMYRPAGTQDLGINYKQRQHIRGAGTVDALFHSRRGQHEVTGTFGQRMLPQYDQNGLLPDAPLFGANYYKLQAFGRMSTKGFWNHVGYLANISGKDDGFSEFYYNRDEQPRLATFSATAYAGHAGRGSELNTGLTWTSTLFRHDDVAFRRNIIDQDGESFEPWMPDGRMHELSWSVRFRKDLTTNSPYRLWLEAKGYNSLIAHVATSENWSNEVYMQPMETAVATPLYRYDWTARSFAGALLENEARLNVSHNGAGGRFDWGADLGVSLDGMLAGAGSRVTPVAVGRVYGHWRPTRWLSIKADLAHDRMTYNVDMLRFMSPRYMNADIRSAVDGSLQSQTGGAHHHYARGLWQPSFVSLDLPVTLRFGRHEIALIQGYKKFYHTWTVQYEGGAAANGYTVDVPLSAETQKAIGTKATSVPVYLLTPGEREYEVAYMPDGLMGHGAFTDTPYWLSQQTRYTYHGRRVEASVGWQSMIGAGYCGLGNGPAVNTVGALTESLANPNAYVVIKNAVVDGKKGRYPAAGRFDQDRAYIARLTLSYIINKHARIGAMGSWTDGQPFVYYFVHQSAMVPAVSRGINPTDANFGCRESAIFHIDLNARFDWKMRGHAAELFVHSYNAYDFGNVLNEFCFPQPVREGRGHNMCLTIPRGFVASLKVGL